MSVLLHIDASPREDSRSRRVGEALVARRLAERPDLRLVRLDLWAADLPHMDGATLAAKYARLAGRPHGADEARAWSVVEALVADLDAAVEVVISTPMWNFSIPYRLKHYIDLVTQPGLSFSFDPAVGYSPRLAARPVHVVLASAGDYRFGPSRGRPDLATPYLREALAFIGLSDVTFIPVGPTIGPADEVAAGMARALDQVAALELQP
jgi:FMN-dependent NADH-azoreductase